jgi:hypothetical protein
MAYRISKPLAATQFDDDKPKKGRKMTSYYDSSSGTTQNTVTKRSGAQKITTTNKSGTKKTVSKVDRKGRVKSTTEDIDLAKGKATTTKKKGSKVVSKKTYKDLTPKQAMMVGAVSKSDVNKALNKERRKQEREDRRYNPNKEKRKQNRRNKKNDRGRLKSFKEIRTDIKDACKGKQKGTHKCSGGKRALK